MEHNLKLAVIIGTVATGLSTPAYTAMGTALSVELTVQSERDITTETGREAAEGRAMDMVASLGGDAIRAFQLRSDDRIKALVNLINRYFDLGFILRNSLPSDLLVVLDDRERIALVNVYQSLAAKDYARAFDDYNGEQIDIVSVTTIGPGVVRVGTRLRSPVIEGGMSIDWIVAGLDTSRAGLRDFIINGSSTLARQQLLTSMLWDAVGKDKVVFLSQIATPVQ